MSEGLRLLFCWFEFHGTLQLLKRSKILEMSILRKKALFKRSFNEKNLDECLKLCCEINQVLVGGN